MERNHETMRQQTEARLISLRGEYDKGQTQLRQLELQLTSLRETMLRISGAVVVLEELLSSSASVTPAEEQPVSNGAHATSASVRSGNG
jgi:hypothetical protein